MVVLIFIIHARWSWSQKECWEFISDRNLINIFFSSSQIYANFWLNLFNLVTFSLTRMTEIHREDFVFYVGDAKSISKTLSVNFHLFRCETDQVHRDLSSEINFAFFFIFFYKDLSLGDDNNLEKSFYTWEKARNDVRKNLRINKTF